MMTHLYADTVFHNGFIASMDSKQNTYEAMAIKDGKILSLHTDLLIKEYIGPDTNVIDLEGKTVLPGFIDAHQHMFNTGFNLLNVNCDCSSAAELIYAIKERANEIGPDDWIIGWGYNESNFTHDEPINKHSLAGISNPVFISRYCLHTAVVNERALQLANISKDSQVEGGIIEKDESGELTGVLKERAMDLVKNALPSYDEESLKKMLLRANEEYIRYGITSVHETGLGFFSGSMNEFKVLQQLQEDKKLNVRIYAMILTDFFDYLNGMKLQGNFGNEYLKIGSVKLFCDGTLGGQTAALSSPYLNSDSNQGLYMYSDDELERRIIDAHEAGYQIAVHAMGDAAIEKILLLFEKALKKHPRKDHRHRIEHAAVTREDLIQKMSDLSVIPIPQYGLIYEMGDIYMKVLDEPAYNYVFASKIFYDKGLQPAGSSDSPVIHFSPLHGIYSAMSRKTKSDTTYLPEQRLSLLEAIETYTVFAARAAFDEKIKGTLEIGKLADMVVLPANFLQFSADQVRDTKVDMTIIGGDVVFQHERSYHNG
ncbi:amidohydrolase [Bacillus badius]|uniref:Exoenzymes regulatory protein AepA n=1 Tax=Bacillus badius TaxID=1455 RepID=A0ABR5AZT2_BACBA|nr:amidohydrolase [Bacillus badius]KIL80240.1 Exoenzymes regulatory protein AepA precursor [Bacillus badius]MED4716987.1 amidohydrolase [Bacillus badius]